MVVVTGAAVVEVVVGGEVVVVVLGAGSEVAVETAAVGGAVVAWSAVESPPQAVATMDSADSKRIGCQAGKRCLVWLMIPKGICSGWSLSEVNGHGDARCWDRVDPNGSLFPARLGVA